MPGRDAHAIGEFVPKIAKTGFSIGELRNDLSISTLAIPANMERVNRASFCRVLF